MLEKEKNSRTSLLVADLRCFAPTPSSPPSSPSPPGKNNQGRNSDEAHEPTLILANGRNPCHRVDWEQERKALFMEGDRGQAQHGRGRHGQRGSLCRTRRPPAETLADRQLGEGDGGPHRGPRVARGAGQSRIEVPASEGGVCRCQPSREVRLLTPERSRAKGKKSSVSSVPLP